MVVVRASYACMKANLLDNLIFVVVGANEFQF